MQTPYLYVYVLKDGSYQELSEEQKAYLEKEFHPGDSARPYINKNYKEGEGFLPRYLLPKNILKNQQKQ